MAEISSPLVWRDSVAVLFHPSVVPVVDVFRSIGGLEDQYDLALLDGPEQALTPYVPPGSAKGIVSDALLLAFALSRQRGRSFDLRLPGSRHASPDEYCLMILIGSSRRSGSKLAREAAALLGVAALDILSALTGELVRQIDLGTIAFRVPTLPEFRAMIGLGEGQMDAIVESFRKPGRQFNL